MSEREASSGLVVNLCFHGIGAPGRDLEPGEERYWIDVDQFEAMLAVIRRHPSVRITFDDGNASDVELALPALLRRNLTASFFVIAGRLGKPGCLSAEDVRALARAGMTVGSHGMRHRPWRSLDDASLHEELAGAAEAIADAAGQSVDQASCPFGSYDRRVLAALRRQGFARVYTVDGRPARPDRWLQPRYTVRSVDTPELIQRLGRQPRDGLVATAVCSAKRSIKRWR